MIIDDCDAELSKIGWGVAFNPKDRTPYAQATIGGKKVYLHRLILGQVIGRSLERYEITDHINHDGLDNRRDNLRVASLSESQWNTRKRKNSTSGYKGVTWNKKDKKWRAQIFYLGKKFHLGSFDDPKEASEAYKKKATELHGKFVNLE